MTSKSCSVKAGTQCNVSTGICDRLTFGSGKLNFHGYWEIPCEYHARLDEVKNLSPVGTNWPRQLGLSELKMNSDLQRAAKRLELLNRHNESANYHAGLQRIYRRVSSIEDRFFFGNKRCKALRNRLINRSRQVFAEAKALHKEYLSLTERNSDG